MKSKGALTGIAGEYFVAAELSRRGYVASVTLKNTKGIDIMASNMTSTHEKSKAIGIQVKANSRRRREWVLNQKAEDYSAKNIFYVFVDLIETDALPQYHIVPSKVVEQYAKEEHQKWLETPGKKGQQHNTSSMRMFRDKEDKYLGRWDLLWE